MLTIGSKRGNTFKYAIGVFEDGLVMHVYDNPFMTTRRTTLYEPIDAEAIRSRRMISRFIDSKSGIIPSPYRAVLKR